MNLTSWLPEDWADFFDSLSTTDIIAGAIPAFLVIYTVFPSVVYTFKQRNNRGNCLAVIFSIKYIAEYIFNHPKAETFVTGALLTVIVRFWDFILITVVIYHFENMGIVKPAIPLSVLWGTTTLTTLYYTTSTHDISHEIYLISSLLMFMLEWAAPPLTSKLSNFNGNDKNTNHIKSD
ncbi:12223_t:CDS:2 [Entrophospora sp. SA101]|nr:12223_t:CDS:2 [Entrophospora sp. SA101]